MAKKSNKYDPGTGASFQGKTKRIINKDGTFNVIKLGAKFRMNEAYLIFIKMNWLQFLGVLLSGYLVVNALFAFVYFFLGDGAISDDAGLEGFDHYLHCFFFSTQTFTTVGYGALSPVSGAASFIASLEALVGFLSFSLATGLLFGRFSKPTAKIRFSEHALVHDVNGTRSLIFRIINERPSQLMDLHATVILNMQSLQQGTTNRIYSQLNLEIEQIQFFPLNWTIVHPIDEQSPLNGLTDDQILKSDGELLIHIRGYDEMFAQEVHLRHSYLLEEVLFGQKFKRIFSIDDDGDIVLRMDELNETVPFS